MIGKSLRILVRRRARDRCESCQLPQHHSPLARLQIEHIIPRKHGGSDDKRNLALACIDCNLHKGSNQTGIDPESTAIVELFNPRTRVWADHFRWQAVRVVGIIAIGRATVRVMARNSDERAELRETIPLMR